MDTLDLYRLCVLKGITLTVTYNENMDAICFYAKRDDRVYTFNLRRHDASENGVPVEEILRKIERSFEDACPPKYRFE